MMQEEGLFMEAGDRIEGFFGNRVMVAGSCPKPEPCSTISTICASRYRSR